MANTVYENKVIEARAKDLLLTGVNSRNYMTSDTSLTESAGMTKTINVYTYTGEAQELEKGEKNTERGSISYVGTDYKVKRVQQVFDYFDDDFMSDNTIVDNMLKGANQVMINKMSADFLTEALKAPMEYEASTFGYEAIVDAIAKLNLEDESGIFVAIPNSWKADLRKDADYKAARMGEVVYSGQVGTICGIPVVANKGLDSLPTPCAFVGTKEAVKLFMKKDVEVEQDRDKEAKSNTVILSTYYICALADATKICKITKTA